ncbi:MAG: hypothetical protein RJA34_1748 [Pseudomonadota bacterium]|jgi:hypothetical protein
MNTYHIRCIEADYPVLLALGETLGAISVNPETQAVAATHAGCWDYIGHIARPTGETVATEMGPQPVMAPLLDLAGHPYIHINLRTPLALGEVAQQMAAANPDIAAGLADLGRFFLLDEAGNARAPTNPHRVFFA